MTRGAVAGGILALSLTVVLMGATASTASAAPTIYPWLCPPLTTPVTSAEQIPQGCLGNWIDSFNFGYNRLGMSASQSFALGGSDYTLTPSISVSGDYTQTNNCPPTLSAGAFPQIDGCMITVSFAPTGNGPSRGTLSSGPGGPEVALEGHAYLGRSFNDPGGDPRCERGREGYGEKPCSDSTMHSADIVRVTAGHEGTRLRHTIRVVGKFQSGSLDFSTDSDESCEWWLGLERGKPKVEFRNLRECTHQRAPGGRARIEFHRHTVEVSFRERSIGSPDGYGWQAWTSALGSPDRGLAYDSVPGNWDDYLRHESG